mmetsp:Transcript_43273/g.69572  ORF Transcript_43273/g.69572 Transcript_43273/m.69572 type:complete len:128 (+) Transcript_43273:1-384(+)
MRGANTRQREEAESNNPIASPCIAIGVRFERKVAGQLRQIDSATAKTGNEYTTPVLDGSAARIEDASANRRYPPVNICRSEIRRAETQGRMNPDVTAATAAVPELIAPRNVRPSPRLVTSVLNPVPA